MGHHPFRQAQQRQIPIGPLKKALGVVQPKIGKMARGFAGLAFQGGNRRARLRQLKPVQQAGPEKCSIFNAEAVKVRVIGEGLA